MYTLHKVDTLEKKNRGKNVNNDDFSVSPSPVLWEHQKNSNNEYSVWLSLLLVKTNNNFFRRIAPFEPERRRLKMTEWQIIFLQILSDWVIHLQYRAWVEMWWYDFSSDTVKQMIAQRCTRVLFCRTLHLWSIMSVTYWKLIITGLWSLNSGVFYFAQFYVTCNSFCPTFGETA